MQVWNDQQMETNVTAECNFIPKRLQPFIGSPQLTTRCSELTIQRSMISTVLTISNPSLTHKNCKKYTRVATLFGVFFLSGTFCSFMQFPNTFSLQFFQNKTYACASHLLCNKEILFDPNNITDHHGTAKGLKILSLDSVETSRKQGKLCP